MTWICPLLFQTIKNLQFCFNKRTFLTNSLQISSDMEEDWNDLAQSENDEPKLVTQIILIVVVAVMVMVFFLGM